MIYDSSMSFDKGPRKETVSGLYVHGLADSRKSVGAEDREGKKLSVTEQVLASFRNNELPSLDGARVAVDHMLAHSGISEKDFLEFATTHQESMKEFIEQALRIMSRIDGGREKDSKVLFERLRNTIPSSEEVDYRKAA